MFFKKQIKRLKKAGGVLALGGAVYCAYHAGCHVTKAKLKTSNERKLNFQYERTVIPAVLSMPVNMKRLRTYPCVLILTDADYPQENSRKIAEALASKGIISLRYPLTRTDYSDEQRLDIAQSAMRQLKYLLHVNQKQMGVIGIGKGCREAMVVSGKQAPLARCLWNLDMAEPSVLTEGSLLCVNASEDCADSRNHAKTLVNSSHDAAYLLIKDSRQLLAGKGLDNAVLHTCAFMKRHLTSV